MVGVISVVGAILLRMGLQWVLGKKLGTVITVLWTILVIFFSLFKMAPPFPIGIFKGMSCTTATFILIGIVVAPFVIAKIAIQGSTGETAKAWLGGFLFCVMTVYFVGVWALSSFLDIDTNNQSLYEHSNYSITNVNDCQFMQNGTYHI